MVKTFRFLEFPVYTSAKDLYKELVLTTKKFPREYWDLGDQIRRAGLSVCLNIAEGSAKISDKDFNRYLGNSLGSINEVVAALDIALSMGIIDSRMLQEYLSKAESIAKQLGGFSKKLRSA